MSRIVWPQAFQLFTGRGSGDIFLKLAHEVVKELFPKFLEKPPDANHTGPPVSLRWMNTPNLGFPRQPFKVFRRRSGERRFHRLASNLSVTGSTAVGWGLREMCRVRINATPNLGQTLIVDALDRRGEVMPGQRITFAASATGLFQAPGIAALRIIGTGTILQVDGVDQFEFANLENWELIELVGLPFDAGEISSPDYDPFPQGFVTPSRTGFEAAQIRLQIATALHQSLPDTGVIDVPTPAWPPPKVSGYLKLLRDPDPCTLRMIEECLRKTDDTTFAGMQANFLFETKLDGIRQADLPGATPGPDSTVVKIPVVGVTMLAVASDSYSATGLGYGTVDFPPSPQTSTDQPGGFQPIIFDPGIIQPGVAPKRGEPDLTPLGIEESQTDYMVTAEFVLPLFGKIELAALGQARPVPEPPIAMAAASLRHSRAPVADARETESVKLTWNYSLLPQSYGVLVSPEPARSQLLNSARPIAGGFEGFTAPRPTSVNGNPPAGQAEFINPVSPVPLSGSQTSRYMVIGLDVFGRWSSWGSTNYLVSAPPVQEPGLHSAQIETGLPLAAHVVSSRIEIEFAWDWTDRSVDRVEFHGKFIPSTAAPDSAFTGGFALLASGSVGPAVMVQFDAARHPSISSSHVGSVEVLPSTLTPPDSDRTKYRLTIQNLTCDFTVSPELAYEVFARAAERVRPAELSALVGPRVARIFDPTPPTIPPLPIDLQWTAFPDATGRARGVLSWPTSPGAAGYVVWEATETALRHIVDPTRPDLAVGSSLMSRAGDLRSILAATGAESRSLIAFSRVNTQILNDTKMEIELPGNSSSIFAYRVSAVSRNNVESSRSSTVALFAVPRRNQPQQPQLMLRSEAPTLANPTGSIRVIAISRGGAPAAGYRVYRVRNSALLMDVGSKGPPKIAHDDPGWANFTLETRDGGPGEKALAITDRVDQSWYPYYYQVVALGDENLVEGEYRGESLPSAIMTGFLAPSNPPSLELVSFLGNVRNRVITFRTSLPVKRTSLGTATIELLQLVRSSDGTRMTRRRSLLVNAHEVREGPPLVVLPAPTRGQLTRMPEMNRRETDASGITEFTVRVKGAVGNGIVLVRDPLDRSVEIVFPEVP
jgi:hypothetical protein